MKRLSLFLLLLFSRFAFSQGAGVVYAAAPLTIDQKIALECKDCDTLHLCGKEWIACGKFENGKKSGPWKYISSTGLVSYSGSYVNGKKEGEWNYLPENTIYHYKNDKLDGEVIFRQWNGNVSERRHYHDGKADGDWITYNEDGVTQLSVIHYRNGVPFGDMEYRNGNVTWRGPVDKNGYQGKWIALENGKEKGGGKYVNGKPEGYWLGYRSVSEVESGAYLHGEKTGRWEFRFGVTREVAWYENGKRNGPDSTWLNDTLRSVYNYVAEQPAKKCVDFYSNGQPKQVKEYLANGKISVQQFAANGTLLVSGTLETNPEFAAFMRQKRSKDNVHFPPELALDMIERNISGVPYIYGSEYIAADADSAERYMRWKQQHPDTAHYLSPLAPIPPAEIRTGTWTFYYANGNKKEEGEFLPKVSGEYLVGDPVFYKTGWWMMYDESGKLIRRQRFDNGNLAEEKNAQQ